MFLNTFFGFDNNAYSTLTIVLDILVAREKKENVLKMYLIV